MKWLGLEHIAQESHAGDFFSHTVPILHPAASASQRSDSLNVIFQKRARFFYLTVTLLRLPGLPSIQNTGNPKVESQAGQQQKTPENSKACWEGRGQWWLLRHLAKMDIFPPAIPTQGQEIGNHQ